MTTSSQPALADLPFVTVRDGQPQTLWAVSAAGDYAADNATGAGHASALLEHMAAADNPSLLGMVAQDIAQGGVWTGIEVGFFHHLAAAAIRTR